MRALLFSTAVVGALITAAVARDISGTAGNDLLMGTPAADRIDALGGDDEVFGLADEDVLDGGDGNDELFGGDGDDTLAGGDGIDFLDGREGDDTLTGGPGRDAFVYYAGSESGSDTITDFDGAEDTIALHEFAAAEIEIRTEGGATVLDLPGPGRITLLGVTRLDDDDIIFEIDSVVR